MSIANPDSNSNLIIQTPAAMAALIDHTLLKPDATESDIAVLCKEAVKHSFYSVCVSPCFVRFAKQQVIGSSVRVCTVVGFPLGTSTLESKVFETEQAVFLGADEIDMVIHIGALKMGHDESVLQEINAICKAATPCLVKVIVETALLTQEEKQRVATIVKQSRAEFIKTSTGFAKAGATVEDVSLFYSVLGKTKKIKASGGVRQYQEACAMVQAGATRLGTSQGVAIVQGAETRATSSLY